LGREGGAGPAGKKKWGRGKEWACWAEKERGREIEKFCIFLKKNKHIQIKFEFRNSNSK
jgi:hypothetical protein